MSYARHRSWGEFYAGERLAPMLELARRGLDPDTVTVVQCVMDRCEAGDFDDDDGRPGCTAICGAETDVDAPTGWC